jgi:hypothetical protein
MYPINNQRSERIGNFLHVMLAVPFGLIGLLIALSLASTLA